MIEIPFTGDNKPYPRLLPKEIRMWNVAIRGKALVISEHEILSNNMNTILLDSGATHTCLPARFAKELNLSLGKKLIVFKLGTGIAFYRSSDDTVKIELEAKTGKGKNLVEENEVAPIVASHVVPHIRSDIEIPNRTISFNEYEELKLKFNLKSAFEAKIATKTSINSLVNRRLELKEESIITKDSWLLLGRDWQNKFKVTFNYASVSIQKRRKSKS